MAIAAVSPHLDDAVLGCGAFLASHPGATVITVFAGRPLAGSPIPPWDVSCGFSQGDDVIGARRAEDREALSILGATPLWLPFLDSQYAPSPPPVDVARAIEEALSNLDPRTVLVPLGLFHSDHHVVALAAVSVARARPGVTFLAYEEATYRSLQGEIDVALATLASQGVSVERASLPSAEADCQSAKRRAVLCYRSQLRGLDSPGRPGYAGAFAPESFWRLRA